MHTLHTYPQIWLLVYEYRMPYNGVYMKKNDTRIPPQSIESEQAVLGAIMMRPGSLYDIDDIMTLELFYADKHRVIYEAMIDLNKRGDPIDLLTLTNVLREQKRLERVGGAAYLTDLVNKVPSTTNVRHYAEIVYKKAMLRGLIEAADDISQIGFDESDQPVDDVLDTAEKRIFSVTQVSKGQKFVSIKQTLKETWEGIEKLQGEGGGLRGVSTGFKQLDALTSGLQKSDLIILAARPSMGKTTLALDIARHAAVRENVAVGIFSLEMSAQQLATRLLSAESKVHAWKMRTGGLSRDEDFGQIRDSLDLLSKAPIYIDDQAGNSIVKMRSVARRLKAEHGLGLIVVDYLQLMQTSKNHDSMVNQVTEISRSLKGLARELDVPVLALSQLSRAVEQRGGKPRLSDLRDSGSIEQDADIVMFIHRDDKINENSDRPNIAEILIEKHRNGPTGSVSLYFDGATTSFLDLDTNHDANAFSSTTKKDSFNDFASSF